WKAVHTMNCTNGLCRSPRGLPIWERLKIRPRRVQGFPTSKATWKNLTSFLKDQIIDKGHLHSRRMVFYYHLSERNLMRMLNMTDRMKVLMFGSEFPPHISGGLGTAVFRIDR